MSSIGTTGRARINRVVVLGLQRSDLDAVKLVLGLMDVDVTYEQPRGVRGKFLDDLMSRFRAPHRGPFQQSTQGTHGGSFLGCSGRIWTL